MMLETLAILLCPIGIGLVAGLLLRLLKGRRLSGPTALVACLLLPPAFAAILTICFPIVGLWDAVAEGLLCGAGVMFAAHRAYTDWRNPLLTTVSLIAALLLLEVGVRVSLPDPPSYPIGDEGPSFLLANVLRTTGPDSPTFYVGGVPYFVEKTVMQGEVDGPMGNRPPGAMVTREIVCSIAYGSVYAGVIDVSREREAVFPQHFTARPDASRRVLHVGDSMVFGANVARDKTFTAELGELEPDVQHINGGISGMAPDDYLVVLRKWIARTDVDLAVMYLFAGNDMVGLDAPHPCSNWQSLLVYEGEHAQLRFPAAPRNDRNIGFRWLLVNSPLPYLGRIAILGHSSAAAYLGGVLDSWSAHEAGTPAETKVQHLESILRSAHDELAAKQIKFVVVVLPAAGAIDIPDGPSDRLSKDALAVTTKLGIPLLDATQTIRAALLRGEQPIQGDHVHFNEEGHRLMARWLHDELARSSGATEK